MKICILTQPLHTNYGGLLQAYALQTVLKRMGHEVVTDRYGASKIASLGKRILYFGYHFLKRYILQDKRYNPFNYIFTSLNTHYEDMCKQIAVNTERFIDTHIDTIDFFQGKQIPNDAVLNQFDALVVGSDQVWRPQYSYIPAYFLDFAIKKPIKRIAYATSFGVEHWELSSTLTKRCAQLAKQFDAISVREDSGVEFCKQYLGVEAVHLLDPTLLLDKADYIQLIEEKDRETILENRMMCYILDQSPEKQRIVNYISAQLGLIPLNVMPEERLSATLTNVPRCIFPSVSEWLNGFRCAKFVVTDSFHGTVFAIIFNKPFVAILNAERGSSRFVSFLRVVGLQKYAVNSLEELTEERLQSINSIAINEIIENWKIKGVYFLEKNFTG